MLHFFVNTETHSATQSEQVNFYTERCKLTGSWYRGSLSTQTSSQPGSGPFVRVTFLPACKFHIECVTFFHLPPSPPLGACQKPMIRERFGTHLDSISSRIAGSLCIAQLSMTITEFGAGKRFICGKRPSINFVKSSVLKEPSMISQWSIPSRDMAGRME